MAADDFERKLAQYAEVLVRVGLNLRPGQRLLIAGGITRGGAPIETAPLVRAVAEQAYRAGARYVEAIWRDEALIRARVAHAPRDSFAEYPAWFVREAIDYAQRGDALFWVAAQDPDLFAGADEAVVSTLQKTAYQQGDPLLKLVAKNVSNWCAAAAPYAPWTARVLPDLPEAAREAAMWELIFRMSRIIGDDPLAGWHAHIRALGARAAQLNAKQYAALHLTGPGTDLRMGLPAGHIWRSAGMQAANGIAFTANIPTEEVFTLPHKDQVEGVVRSTRPLSVSAGVIDDFELVFERGRVVQAQAKVGDAHLQRLLETDAGARFTGEIALVPHSSPISQAGRLFYNILFDENASIHIALGNAYRFSLEGGEALSDAEWAARGGNSSMIHVDFMVGSEAINVDGITAGGAVEPLLRGGEWVSAV